MYISLYYIYIYVNLYKQMYAMFSRTQMVKLFPFPNLNCTFIQLKLVSFATLRFLLTHSQTYIVHTYVNRYM